MATFGGGSSDSTTTEYMTNTSTIDVTQPLPLPLPHSDSSTTPSTFDQSSNYTQKYLQHVEPVAQQIVLEAGDVLVMPPG